MGPLSTASESGMVSSQKRCNMSSPQIDASLSYAARPEPGEKPAVYVYTPPPGTPQRSTEVVRHPARIANARESAALLSLDIPRFALTTFISVLLALNRSRSRTRAARRRASTAYYNRAAHANLFEKLC